MQATRDTTDTVICVIIATSSATELARGRFFALP